MRDASCEQCSRRCSRISKVRPVVSIRFENRDSFWAVVDETRVETATTGETSASIKHHSGSVSSNRGPGQPTITMQFVELIGEFQWPVRYCRAPAKETL